MANKPTSSAGSIIGLVVGVVLVGGIVGTPLYLATLQTDAAALDEAVRDDVETLRRIVLNLNANLEPIQLASKAIAAEGEPRKGDIDEVLAANRKLLAQAEEIVQKLRNVRKGEILADRQLAVAQVKAILYLSEGWIHANRADFEEVLATKMRRAAEERLGTVAELQRSLSAIDAQAPAVGIAQLQELIKQTESELAGPKKEIATLGDEIEELERRIARLDETAAKARQGMAAMEGRPWSAQHEHAYVELSDQARRAEAEATSLRTGSLEGGKVVFPGAEDWVEATYEGGKPLPGVSALKDRLADRKDTVAVLEKLKEGLEEQRKALESQAAALEAEKAKLNGVKNEQIKAVEEMIGAAAQHSKAAAEARDQALATLEKKALDFAEIGIKAAKDRVRDANSAMSEQGDAAGEWLKRISKDGETEAALDCLAANIAYTIAVQRLQQLNALQAEHDSRAFFCRVVGGEPPTADSARMEELRTKAAADLKTATERLKNARELIKRTSLRAPDGATVSGTNYVWPIDVGQAAIHMLEANLSGDRAARLDALRKADELLRDAAKDRDQSPLLTPAIETLQYLQRTVK